MGERSVRIRKVEGSTPFSSTINVGNNLKGLLKKCTIPAIEQTPENGSLIFKGIVFTFDTDFWIFIEEDLRPC